MPFHSTHPSIDCLYRDEFIVVVEKASGELVHRGWGREGPVLVERLRVQLDVDKLHAIHRLDRGTSGIVVFAFDPETARMLSEIWSSDGVRKRYIALVRGTPPASGQIDHPIPRRVGGPRVSASSTFRLVATAETEPRTTSLVEVMPLTGRLHQVRRHLKHINHPVIGDANYGRGRLNRAMADRYGLHRLALHALSLTLTHPQTGEELNFLSQLPRDLAEPLTSMGFNDSLVSYSKEKP